MASRVWLAQTLNEALNPARAYFDWQEALDTLAQLEESQEAPDETTANELAMKSFFYWLAAKSDLAEGLALQSLRQGGDSASDKLPWAWWTLAELACQREQRVQAFHAYRKAWQARALLSGREAAWLNRRMVLLLQQLPTRGLRQQLTHQALKAGLTLLWAQQSAKDVGHGVGRLWGSFLQKKKEAAPSATEKTSVRTTLNDWSRWLWPGWVGPTLQSANQALERLEGFSALSQFSSVLERYPACQQAALGKLQALYLERPVEESRAYGLLLVQRYPLEPLIPYVLALGHMLEGEGIQAIEAFRKVILLGKGNDLAGKSHFYLAKLFSQAQYPELAIDHLQMALTLCPDLKGELQTLLNDLCFQTERYDWLESLSWQAFQQYPTLADLHWANLGYLASMQEQWGPAVRAYQQALLQNPTLDVALNNLGVIELDCLNHRQAAKALFEKAAAVHPGYALAEKNLQRLGPDERIVSGLTTSVLLEVSPDGGPTASEVPSSAKEDSSSSSLTSSELSTSPEADFQWLQQLFEADASDTTSSSSRSSSSSS
jgi:tetratricopeptide (TPR) repeat protein